MMRPRILCTLVTLAVFSFLSFAFAEEPTGWYIWGKDTHKVNVDRTVYHSEPTSYSVESLPNAKSSDRGGLTQSDIIADKYKGKKVKLSGYLKGEDVKHAFIWLQARVSKKKYVESDTYIKDKKANEVNTDWTPFEMVMTVPKESETIGFGLNMGGKGKIWIDDIEFEIVPQNTPEKFDNFVIKGKDKPVNLP